MLSLIPTALLKQRWVWEFHGEIPEVLEEQGDGAANKTKCVASESLLG